MPLLDGLIIAIERQARTKGCCIAGTGKEYVMSVEFWTMGAGSLRAPEQLRSGTQQAVCAEEIGYDGIVYVDNQNRWGDC